MFKSVIIAALIALPLGLAAPALACAAPSYEQLDAQEARDRDVVAKAMAGFNARGARGLRPHLGALEAVLAGAPKSYPLTEARDGVLISRKGDPVLGGLPALTGTTQDGKAIRLEMRDNVYGYAAWLLAWAAVEAGDPEKALKAVEPMLARQPYNPMLVAERGAALNLQKRWADAFANYDGALKNGDPVPDKTRAMLLRGRGFALIELERLDEAEADYVASLKLEPNHGGAQNELAYIQQQRAGKPKTQTGVFTSDEAREMGKDHKGEK